MGGFLSTSHAHNHTSSSAGPPPGSNPPAHPHSITRLSRGTLLFMWIGFFITFMCIERHTLCHKCEVYKWYFFDPFKWNLELI